MGRGRLGSMHIAGSEWSYDTITVLHNASSRTWRQFWSWRFLAPVKKAPLPQMAGKEVGFSYCSPAFNSNALALSEWFCLIAINYSIKMYIHSFMWFIAFGEDQRLVIERTNVKFKNRSNCGIPGHFRNLDLLFCYIDIFFCRTRHSNNGGQTRGRVFSTPAPK